VRGFSRPSVKDHKEFDMRSTVMTVAALLVIAPMWASAQTSQAAPPAPRPAVDINKAALDAAAKIGAAALKPGVSVSDRNISLADIGPYNVTVAYVTRPATKVPSGRVLSHDKITEIYYVVSGHGTQVTGTLADGTKESGSTTIGPGWSSTSPIKDGRSTTLGPGEMQIIPPGTGHVWTEIAEGGIVYMTIRIDPEHVLALSK
jgi:mannose-6-phosphate isomerase-like protein (cupin superfamily)